MHDFEACAPSVRRAYFGCGSRSSVPVDGRIACGRDVRHAPRILMAHVPTAARIVVAAANNSRHDGFGVDDIAWLLRNAHGEVLVVRPDPKAHPVSIGPPEQDPPIRANPAACAAGGPGTRTARRAGCRAADLRPSSPRRSRTSRS